MYRKRPFATGGQRRHPARAAVCRIPCLILCLADVELEYALDLAQRWPGCWVIGTHALNQISNLLVLPSSSVGEESLSPNHPDTSSRF